LRVRDKPGSRFQTSARISQAGETPEEVYRLTEELFERAREAAPSGLLVFEPKIRGYRGGPFIPTIEPESWTRERKSGKRGRRAR